MTDPGEAPRQAAPFWLLALVIGSAMSATHILVPALPLIAADYSIFPAKAQAAVSFYLLAVAAGQIIYGPLSDWYGRRPVLIGGMAVFTFAGLLATIAPTFELLLAARILQGAGGCAGMAMGRAIVQDNAGERDAASMISRLNSILMLSPVVAPLAGLWLAGFWGWRIIPAMLTLLGVVGLAGSITRLAETAPRRSSTLRQMAGQYLRLIRFGPFLAYVLAGSLGTTSMFALLTSAPFILTKQLGRPLSEIGLLYTILICGVILGNFLSGRLLRRFGFERLMMSAFALGLFGSLLILPQAIAGALSLTTFLLGGMIYTQMCGMMASLSLVRSVGLAPRLKGSATGLYGFSQMMSGALVVALSGVGQDAAVAVGAIMTASASIGLVMIFLLKRWRDNGGRELE